jgi:preprotein translocase subunit SecF
MFQLIRPGTKFDFVGNRRVAYAISGALCLLSLVLIFYPGPRYGIDFSGGTLMHIQFKSDVGIAQVRQAVSEEGVEVQEYGAGKNEFLLRLPDSAEDLAGLDQQLRTKLDAAFQPGSYEVLRVETVGPRVGRDLRQKALLAIVFSTLMMGIYVALRFEIRFGVGAVVALAHDVLITIGALILFGYEFDLTIIAALLTIVGFSVNDTVIVSDRIRENMRKERRQPLPVIINRSINETLSRTILTNGTAIMMVIVLYVLGGPVIHGFAFTLLIGFIVGTYSSIFVASPIVLAFERSAPATGRVRRAAS